MKAAWETFDAWWQENYNGRDPVKRYAMPAEISEAFRTISEAPIPGYDGATGANSCYVIGVTRLLVD